MCISVDKNDFFGYNITKKIPGGVNMASTRINLTVDAAAKEKALELFKEFGMDASTAVNIYFQTVVRMRKIPFEISVPSPENIFDMDSKCFMEKAEFAVKNRDTVNEPEYVLSMDLNEGIPYKLYKDNRREYLDE